jgi:transcriptional regulator with XRE-family HTH domain
VYIDMKRLRLKSGIGQRELARKMGVTAKIGQKWDKGSQPRAERLPKLVEVLGLDSIEELYSPTDAE